VRRRFVSMHVSTTPHHRHHAVAESLDASLCECDNRLQVRFFTSSPSLHSLHLNPNPSPSFAPSLIQDIATKVVTLVDRFKLSLPVPLRLDRNHGSESLEVGESGREAGREGESEE